MKQKVMIVEDDELVSESLAEALVDQGYEVAAYAEFPGIDIMDSKGLPNIILLDFWLPGKNGDEITRFLKSFPKTQCIPIIILSALPDIDNVVKNSGADDFVPKPFDLDDVIARIDKCLKK